MAKFNSKPESVNSETTNLSGGVAFKLTPKMELYQRVCTCLMENKFYESEGSSRKAIAELVKKIAQTSDAEYVLKLAYYARNDLHLRSVPVYLLVQACKYERTRQYVRAYTPLIIQRADELTETLSLYLQENSGKKSICHALQDGLAQAFYNFNAFQFKKYDREDAVKLRDVIRLVHPVPRTPSESVMFKQIKERTLPNIDTWETFISANGSTKEAWETIMPKMPYMATLRNLRNFLQKGANIDSVIELLTNPQKVARSKQFPYRFYSAYKEIQNAQSVNPCDAQRLLDALNDAIELSVVNMPRFSGLTVLASDNSGSMTAQLSDKSSISRKNVANLLQSISQGFCDKSLCYVFGDTLAQVNVSSRSTIFDKMRQFENTNVGCSTNAYLVIKDLIDRKIVADRVIVFTDEEIYGGCTVVSARFVYSGYGRGYTLQPYGSSTAGFADLWNMYKKTIAPNAKLYMINLAGNGTMAVRENQAVEISGWTERVIEYIKMNDEDGESMVKRISNITLKSKDDNTFFDAPTED